MSWQSLFNNDQESGTLPLKKTKLNAVHQSLQGSLLMKNIRQHFQPPSLKPHPYPDGVTPLTHHNGRHKRCPAPAAVMVQGLSLDF
jgi:hypothetical protein